MLLLCSVFDLVLTLCLSESDPENDSGGFVAVDYGNRLIVVAFRGTRSLLGLIKNLQAAAIRKIESTYLLRSGPGIYRAC